eukprot:1100389-Amorphochlora_amoeboformis.AAC.1
MRQSREIHTKSRENRREYLPLRTIILEETYKVRTSTLGTHPHRLPVLSLRPSSSAPFTGQSRSQQGLNDTPGYRRFAGRGSRIREDVRWLEPMIAI